MPLRPTVNSALSTVVPEITMPPATVSVRPTAVVWPIPWPSSFSTRNPARETDPFAAVAEGSMFHVPEASVAISPCVEVVSESPADGTFETHFGGCLSAEEEPESRGSDQGDRRQGEAADEQPAPPGPVSECVSGCAFRALHATKDVSAPEGTPLSEMRSA